jgi:hypothetical protein
MKKSIDIEFKNNCISKVLVNGQNIIEVWGLETADSAAFFSLSDGGCRHKILRWRSNVSDTTNEVEIDVQMHDGKWNLRIDEELIGNKILRQHTLTTLEDSWFMDFVSRFQFKKKFFEKAIINDIELIHKNTNLYYQFPVDEVKLIGKDFDVVVKVREVITSEKFKLHMYARDSGDVWVVHARLFPYKWDKEIIKVCRSWYNKAIPQKIANILLKVDVIRDFLWYRGERKQANFPLNAYGLVRFEKGSKLRILTETKIL